jgi:ABC-type Mn2+/Zn2+ transport system permease subunit
VDFFDNSFLWLEVVIAAAVSAAAAAVAGVHCVLRRVVFLPAALTQLAGLGVVASFLVLHLAHDLEGSVLVEPRLYALAFAIAGALLLGLLRERRGFTREWLLGAVYIASGALILLVGGHIPQEIHDVNDILFGNAIAIENRSMWVTVGISGVVVVSFGALARPLFAVAFDAQTHGVPVWFLDAAVYVGLGLASATCTRVVGALPAFAFAVFPAAAALRQSSDARAVTALASLLGAVSAFLGYWVSFVLSLPTGACMAAVAGLVFGAAELLGFVRRLGTQGRGRAAGG